MPKFPLRRCWKIQKLIQSPKNNVWQVEETSTRYRTWFGLRDQTTCIWTRRRCGGWMWRVDRTHWGQGFWEWYCCPKGLRIVAVENHVCCWYLIICKVMISTCHFPSRFKFPSSKFFNGLRYQRSRCKDDGMQRRNADLEAENAECHFGCGSLGGNGRWLGRPWKKKLV